MPEDRSADAIGALAAFAIARSLYPSAIELVEYLLDHDEDEIRTDIDAALETAARARERIRALAAERLGANAAESQARIEELETQLDLAHRRASELESEAQRRDDLAQTEADALRLQLNEAENERQRQLDELSAELRNAEHDREQRERELAEANEDRHRIQLKLDTYDALIQDGRAVAAEPSDEDRPPAPTISGVIDVARAECERVVIPDAAPRETDILDADEKAADWARELWKGLRALNAYAEESEFFQGGFWEWCEHSNSEHNLWPATSKKLAMSESDTVMNSGPLRRTRRFLVDTEIERSGYIHMEAHLKISEGGGQHIPRVYFHDDSKGRTNKIHVGFIGPHRLVPNTQS